VVGDGPLRTRLEALATELGIADQVTFLGERNDARPLMAGFDVFLLTSTIEGFPNVLLEAAFLGVPAIASRVGGSPDVLPDPNNLFEAGDISAAAERVVAMLQNPSATARGSAQVRQRALTRFTASQTAHSWFALYDRSYSGDTREA
jgi:glycosyltransferase involved in cell wall biosynthesis